MLRFSSLLLFSLLLSDVRPQVVDSQPPRPAVGRYSILFRERSFDLSTYRAAVAGTIDAGTAIAKLEEAARRDQAEFVAFAARHGARLIHQWWLINGCCVDATSSQIAVLRDHPRVLSVTADSVRLPNEMIRTATDDLNHNADSAHNRGIRGKGVTIAVVDSGVDSTAPMRLRPHSTFYPGGDPSRRTGPGLAGSRLLANRAMGLFGADDPIGHGTSVAGAAAGARWNLTRDAGDGVAPESKIVSYSVVNDVHGGSSVSTLAMAWQAAAADRVQFGTRVAVCSYAGTLSATSPDMQALDAFAEAGDVAVIVAAGNRSYMFVYGATNRLAVGSVGANTRKIVAPRLITRDVSGTAYPNLLANGQALVLPKADAEQQNRVASGTSYAAPLVAGAAALYVSQRPNAHSTEVLAAIAATSQDVRAVNPSARVDETGYLRVDRLVELARSPARALLKTGAVTVQNRRATFSYPVRAGERYSAALKWYRRNLVSVGTSLRLRIDVNGQNVVDTAGFALNVGRFEAQTTGLASVTVEAVSYDSTVPFHVYSVVVVPETRRYAPAAIQSFGVDCGPRLELAGDPMPYLGRTYGFELTHRAQPAAVAVLTLGASSRRYQGLRLPLDLSPFGAPRCQLMTSLESTLPIPVGGTPRRIILGVPRLPVLLGGTIHHQALVLSRANALGVITSNAHSMTIGG